MTTKRKAFAKKETLYAADKVTIVGTRFKFAHGVTFDCLLGDLFNVADPSFADDEARLKFLSDHPIIAQAAEHGVRQKVGDAYGSSPDVKDSRDAEAVARSTWARIAVEGEWNLKAGPVPVPDALILRALFEVLEPAIGAGKVTWEGVEAKFAAMSDDERQGVAKRPDVAPMVAKLKAEEKLAASSGTGGLADLFNDGDGEEKK